MNEFLIPANSKKSMLIFGVFNPFDLILFSSGAGTSILLLIILPLESFIVVSLALMPLLVTGLLVFPVANYHNILTILISIYHFYTDRQKFIWKGWCDTDGQKTNK